MLSAGTLAVMLQSVVILVRPSSRAAFSIALKRAGIPISLDNLYAHTCGQDSLHGIYRQIRQLLNPFQQQMQCSVLTF